ncbi:MAG: hypothetical protein CXR31_11235 [Geobacter sp.]|nr:MAG: hypothetical protein CXR31_11235 [Geobacter sp.]
MCAVIFFLVFLGMRNPALAGIHGAKPRPRAVLESVKKASDEVVKKTFLVATLPSPVTPLPAEQVYPYPPHVVRHVTLNQFSRFAARAPPRSTSHIS